MAEGQRAAPELESLVIKDSKEAVRVEAATTLSLLGSRESAPRAASGGPWKCEHSPEHRILSQPDRR
jgi:hypothetical protein